MVEVAVKFGADMDVALIEMKRVLDFQSELFKVRRECFLLRWFLLEINLFLPFRTDFKCNERSINHSSIANRISGY